MFAAQLPVPFGQVREYRDLTVPDSLVSVPGLLFPISAFTDSFLGSIGSRETRRQIWNISPSGCVLISNGI